MLNTNSSFAVPAVRAASHLNNFYRHRVYNSVDFDKREDGHDTTREYIQAPAGGGPELPHEQSKLSSNGKQLS